MDEYPETFNRKTCIEIMTKNQYKLLKETRKLFYNTIMKFTGECNPKMILDFPNILWHEHKITITKELLERFGKVTLLIINPQANITKPITEIEDFPKNVSKIIIDFPIDC